MKDKVFSCLGASNHSEEERAEYDFYATNSTAAEMLLELEPQLNCIWEPCCVDSQTEYFNGNQWEKISEYVDGEKVQYDCKTKIATLVQPIKYHKYKTDEEFYVYNNKYLDFALTGDHTFIYNHRRKKESLVRKDTVKNIFEKYQRDSNGFRGTMITTFDYNGNLELDETLLRLAVACNADGKMCSKNVNSYSIRVKKDRKKKRIIELLNKANIKYTTTKEKKDYLGVTFRSPLGCKKFPYEWLMLKPELKKVILEEIQYWDGHKYKNYIEYSTSKKEDADFIQLLAHSIGVEAGLHIDIRVNKPNCLPNYRIVLKKKNKHALSKEGAVFKKMKLDGYKYCFTVPTHALVLRRNNKIFITGNCGQGHLAKVFEGKNKLNFATDLIDRGYRPESTRYGYGIDYDLLYLDTQIKYDGDIVTNPPYELGQSIVTNLIDKLETGRYLCMFLKLTFLDGKKRKELFDK